MNLLRLPRGISAAIVLALLSAGAVPSPGQTAPAADLDATQAIGVLRQGLIDSFNKQDMDRMLTYLAPDVVVTWQNGEVCRSPAEVKAYYQKMMQGDQRIVAKITSNPVVDGRQVHGDWAVSYGHMNDRFLLTDGRDLPLDSRFTATISRHGDRWLVSSFHVSTNAFDNPVLAIAAKKGATYGALAGAAGGIIVGLLAGFILLRRRKPATPA